MPLRPSLQRVATRKSPWAAWDAARLPCFRPTNLGVCLLASGNRLTSEEEGGLAMTRRHIGLILFGSALVTGISAAPWLCVRASSKPSAQPSTQAQNSPAQRQPTSAELSRVETPGKALVRQFEGQEYEVRSAAEAMPAEKWSYRPAEGMFKNEKPEFGPAEVRTFAEQVKHVACSNFAFAAELDGTKPPDACDKGGPSPAKTRSELLVYLRDSFAALKKSLSAITVKNMYHPMDGPYATPNTRLGLAEVCIWHAADHYGQMTIYLRLNGIVPPTSRPNPPPLSDQ